MLNDGTDMSSFYQRARRHSNTVLLVQTIDDMLIGYFSACAWHEDASYYGSGESMLFSFRQKDSDNVDVYKWTGKNVLFQYSSATKIAAGGGGGGFGFILDNDFRSVASYACETYGNMQSLLSGPSPDSLSLGSNVVNAELWTFQL